MSAPPADFKPGQRWISESEPELGLGSILQVTDRTVTVKFGGSNSTREYSRSIAPLRRVQFRQGATIRNQKNSALKVQRVAERNGLLFYRGSGQEMCETELSDTLSFNKPEERLLAGHGDPPELFALRLAALEQLHRRRRSAARGFVGGRIDLIPHQLYIAAEVSGRLAPRVLLADEVGLGKTIEACLILHRLILTGRVQRALILVPESLIHQWFVELLRRFNLWFNIFDEQRCEAIEAASPGDNPFLDSQLTLCSIALFLTNRQRVQQALSAGWDILVVDEAHHLGWTPEAVSPEYELVETLGRETPGLLLLTATPEQLGIASHFARLRLLDPERFYDFSVFIEEAEHYRDVARLAEILLSNGQVSTDDIRILAGILADSERNVHSMLERAGHGDSVIRDEMIDALLDQHGVGRVSFRNTRATIAGFPRRIACMHPLPAPNDNPGLLDALAEECAADTDLITASADVTSSLDLLTNPSLDYSRDPRIDWLVGLLRTLGRDKTLVICRTQPKVAAIEAALRQRVNLKVAVFHEQLSLVQRDRNAAWFAERDGARLLVCSEIGSEGRNFQFAHHLILFDLPLDPELLEQRIGRLDRIGQTSEIQVHVPYVVGSAQEALARWYQEGLDAFEKNLHGGREILEQFGLRVFDITQNFHETRASRAALDQLIQETLDSRLDIANRLKQGRDRLLELNSFRPEVAQRLIHQIQQQDEDRSVDEFMLAVLDNYSIEVQEVAPRTYRLGSAGVLEDSFPGLPADGLTVTCDRRRGLAREDVQFLTWDHPLVTGAFDLVLGSEKGNTSFAEWPDAKANETYLEAIYVLECIAPPRFHVDRFLPPTPVRVLVDHQGNDMGSTITSRVIDQRLIHADAAAFWDRLDLREKLLPRMMEQAQGIADSRVPEIVAQARKTMTTQLDHEIARLRELRKVNRSVRSEEIELVADHRRALDEYLRAARPRLDAIRLIRRGT